MAVGCPQEAPLQTSILLRQTQSGRPAIWRRGSTGPVPLSEARRVRLASDCRPPQPKPSSQPPTTTELESATATSRAGSLVAFLLKALIPLVRFPGGSAGSRDGPRDRASITERRSRTPGFHWLRSLPHRADTIAATSCQIERSSFRDIPRIGFARPDFAERVPGTPPLVREPTVGLPMSASITNVLTAWPTEAGIRGPLAPPRGDDSRSNDHTG